ncbi:flagellar hook-associated protein FlgK [Aliiruegeria lutimaris]|uniref:Flagellar hook-associated protein 1 n=1 Tax=Aliiruegeria lutimaris TaxID=571298 RepID=A0A1G8R5G5_9RHOB|nr:flagellar hook-associated protein FlgK [Aliiruegeria lutimaris]SDJ12212.1 flagellar hook-associated protein 1 FlgK [Aliiruegeria lutimaris]
MSLSSSLHSALSGLNAASRAVELVSSNVANAMTDGYAQREINLASQTVGGSGAGVRVVGITRIVNERALADQRDANANMANAETQAAAWLSIETAIGYPTERGSLTDRIDQFEAALISAASRPEETIRLEDAVYKAVNLAEGLNNISDEIAETRMEADADIADMVSQLNTQLEQVQSLNWQIFRMGNSGDDSASLLDERQALVDSISEIIPVHQVERDGNQIALFTPGGATLLDGPAAELSFTPHAVITANMTLENGTLSGLELNGEPLGLHSSYGSIEGGRLAAAFEVRDVITVEAQAGLDALARNLIERFEDSGLDATVATDGLGLFVDGAASFDPTSEPGLAARISVNANIDPDSGGQAWRIRDGVGAIAAGNEGDASLLSAMAESITETRVAASGVSAGVSRSLAGIAFDLLSEIESNYSKHEGAQAFHSARAEAIAYEIAQDGVDTDTEMQKLLLIEQAYAANARVIQTVDELMQHLLEL